MLDSILAMFDPSVGVKVVAILGILSAIKLALDAFGNKENKIVIFFGKLLDFVGYNPKH